MGSEQDEAAWDRYVAGHPAASGYHAFAWARVIREAFGHHAICLMARDETGAVAGVLPLVLLRSRLFGCFLVSLPFVNYGGVLCDREQDARRLCEAAVETARRVGASHVELRQQEAAPLDWTCRQRKVSMRLPLPERFEALWDRFPSKLRSQIRRARKEGMEARIGGAENIEDFYRVFARTMRDLGTPVYGKGFFAAIVKHFPESVKLCVVSLRGKPVAAGLLYGFRRTLEVPWAASDRRYATLAGNMLLYSAMLEHACRSRYEVFDFGRSTVDSGTCRFKEQWGARPVPLHWYYWVPDGADLPELNPQNPRYRLPIQVWKRLPVAVTRWVGPSIVKYIA